MFENTPDAPDMTPEELVNLQKWLNHYSIKHPAYARFCHVNSLFAHPDNIRYIAHLVQETIPEWYALKYKRYLVDQ